MISRKLETGFSLLWVQGKICQCPHHIPMEVLRLRAQTSLLQQYLVSLQCKAFLHLICDHLCNSQGGGGCRWGSIAHMQYSPTHIPHPAIKHKVIHQVPLTVQSLSTYPCGTPETDIKPNDITMTEQCRKQFWFLLNKCTFSMILIVLIEANGAYLSTSLRESSGMYFCRILTWAPINSPLYISPTPYTMFFSTSFWRPL